MAVLALMRRRVLHHRVEVMLGNPTFVGLESWNVSQLYGLGNVDRT